MSRREANKREKWRRIEAAAWAVFGEHGYEAATTREIARRADVATGTLFLYARDKRELVLKLFYGRIATVVEAGFTDLPSDGALVDDLVALFRRLFDTYGEAPELARVFVQAVQFMPPDERAAADAQLHDFLARLVARLARAQAAGEVDAAVPTARAVAAIFTLYFGALTAWLSGRCDAEAALQEHLGGGLALLMAGLAPRGPGPTKGDRP